MMFDSQAPAGDPDIGSNAGNSPSAAFTANPIAPGAWAFAPDVVGPFGPDGVANENVTTAMTTTSNAFDSDVQLVDRRHVAGQRRSVGADRTVTSGDRARTDRDDLVTITPSGAAGSHNSGTLYIDSEDLFQFQVNANVVNLSTGNPLPNGSEVAAIPYSYTVR